MSFGDIFKSGFLKSYANTEITFKYAVLAMFACLSLSLLICVIYYLKSRKYFFSREFALSIVSLSLITTAVILTIQSSIVVSLGMVGALSIVRFRTAIKNPLDLIFLFWSIAIGIICGAGVFYIAVPLTLILSIIVLISEDLPGIHRNKILVMDMIFPYDMEVIESILMKFVKWWNVKTESVHNDSVNLIIEIRGIKEQTKLISSLIEIHGVNDISVLSQEGAVD